MILNSEAVLTVLALNEKASSDGKSAYYNFAVMSNGEVANISCTKEAYDLVKSTWDPAVPMKNYRFLISNSIGKYEYTKSPYAGSGEKPASEKPTTEKPAK